MKFRSFLYLNKDMIDSYLSAIDGGVHDSETIIEKRINIKSGSGGVNARVLSAGGQIGKESNEEIKKDVQISSAAKFDRLFNFLVQSNQVEYYQLIQEDAFAKIERDDFIEVLAKPRFSKVKEWANAAKTISSMTDVFQEFVDTPVIDKETKSALYGMVKLGELKPSKAVTCVFNFEDKAYPIIADLDEKFFSIPQESFVGEVYVLCKIQRKLQRGEKIELDEIFEQFQNIPLNREQRRKMPKKELKNPKEIKDVINGPAFTASVIAVYQ